ncbi:MAG: NADPH:quinone oxidoreductase family protein [Acidimicrobiia bacterium]
MRAVLCKAFGESLALEEVAAPEPGPGEVLIDVRAAGVNFPDLLITQGLYQSRPPLPFAPGFEVAGRVSEVGDGATSMSIGDRVMATFEYGGYAEQAVAPEASVVRLPDEMSFEEAAGFPIAYGTVYHALIDRAALQEGETLLVTGASGGVGLAAVQVGSLLGARVIAAVGSPTKAELTRRHGAADTIDYQTEDLRERVKQLTGGAGADVIFDPVGGEVFDQCVRSVAWGGRLLVIGFTSGRIPEVPTNLVLLKGSSIVGVFWGGFMMRDPGQSRGNFLRLFAWLDDGVISPYISAVYPLDRATEAMEAVAARRTTGKLVLDMGRR